MTRTSTSKKAAASKAELKTIGAVRAHTADILKGFNTATLTRYEMGFRAGFNEFANHLHPAGYSRDRPSDALIAGLLEPPTKPSTARVQSIEAVRQHLDDYFAAIKKEPSDTRFLYGYEDAYWFLWRFVDPMGFWATRDYLPR